MKKLLLITMLLGAVYADCPALGDVNDDGNFNVLDVVVLVDCILAHNCLELEFACAADLNADGAINVLDIVSLTTCILAANCSG